MTLAIRMRRTGYDRNRYPLDVYSAERSLELLNSPSTAGRRSLERMGTAIPRALERRLVDVTRPLPPRDNDVRFSIRDS
jgi:hypothetical protein